MNNITDNIQETTEMSDTIYYIKYDFTDDTDINWSACEDEEYDEDEEYYCFDDDDCYSSYCPDEDYPRYFNYDRMSDNELENYLMFGDLPDDYDPCTYGYPDDYDDYDSSVIAEEPADCAPRTIITDNYSFDEDDDYPF